jgi:hypothetical protein
MLAAAHAVARKSGMPHSCSRSAADLLIAAQASEGLGPCLLGSSRFNQTFKRWVEHLIIFRAWSLAVLSMG